MVDLFTSNRIPTCGQHIKSVKPSNPMQLIIQVEPKSCSEDYTIKVKNLQKNDERPGCNTRT